MNASRIVRRGLLILSLAGVLALAGCEIFQNLGFTEPDTPVGLTVGAATDTTLGVSWSTASGATSYQVFRSFGSNGPWVTQVYNSTQAGFTDTGLTPATTYYYAVQATNSAGSSSLSMAASGTTTGPSGGGGTTILSEDFEGAFPGSWAVGSYGGYSTTTWSDTDYDASTGLWSGFCAGSANVDFYDNSMYAYMAQTVSLSGYTSASLSLNYWLNSESDYDYFEIYVNGSLLFGLSGYDNTYWNSASPLILDLSSFAGQGSVTISLEFYSDTTNVVASPSGVWVDNILLTAE